MGPKPKSFTLCEAAERGDAQTLARLLAEGVNVDERDGDEERCGDAPIMLAASYGFAACVALLIEAGCYVDARDESDNSPLILAAWGGHEACVELLAKAGCDVEARDSWGKTALMWAAERGKLECVRALARLGADLDAGKGLEEDVYESFGKTALMAAAKEGRAACVAALLEAGANARIKDADGERAVDYARRVGALDCLEVFEAERAKRVLESAVPKKTNGGRANSLRV
jgi:ankyrin repeat protein